MKAILPRFPNSSFKKNTLITLIGLIVGISIYAYMAHSEALNTNNTGFNYSLSGLCGVFVAYIIYTITLWLNQILPWQLNTGSRLLTGILLNSLAAFITVFSLSFLYIKIAYPTLSLLPDYLPFFIKLGILLFILVIIYTVIYFALYAYHQYASVQVENVRQERKQMNLQFNALKAQLSPHFLFNSLNTISSLIYSDLNSAETFIRKLAKSYQYSLTSYKNKWVPLRQEIDFVQSYQYLLQIRFGERLILLIDIPYPLLETKIPPLTIQLLIENAAKHNEMTIDRPLKIEISTDKDWIWVINNKTETPNSISSFKIGLENIKARYKILANRKVVIIDNEKFTVKLPILK